MKRAPFDHLSAYHLFIQELLTSQQVFDEQQSPVELFAKVTSDEPQKTFTFEGSDYLNVIFLQPQRIVHLESQVTGNGTHLTRCDITRTGSKPLLVQELESFVVVLAVGQVHAVRSLRK